MRIDIDKCQDLELLRAECKRLERVVEAHVRRSLDIEDIENGIVNYWSKQIVGMPISGIGGITATLKYLEAKGYLK